MDISDNKEYVVIVACAGKESGGGGLLKDYLSGGLGNTSMFIGYVAAMMVWRE
jgi:hypothetical protein